MFPFIIINLYKTALWGRSYSNPHLIRECIVKMPITVASSVNCGGDDGNNSSSRVVFVTVVTLQPHISTLTESI